MVKTTKKRIINPEKKIKTESGKRLYALLQEDRSHSRRVKMILTRLAASIFIIFIIIVIVMYLV